jgi:hypothetical protein
VSRAATAAAAIPFRFTPLSLFAVNDVVVAVCSGNDHENVVVHPYRINPQREKREMAYGERRDWEGTARSLTTFTLPFLRDARGGWGVGGGG